MTESKHDARKALVALAANAAKLDLAILTLVKDKVRFVVTEQNEAYAVTIEGYQRGSHTLELATAMALSRFNVRYSEDLEAALQMFRQSPEDFSSFEERLVKDENFKLTWTTHEIKRLDQMEDFLLNISESRSIRDWGEKFADILDRPPGAYRIGKVAKWPPPPAPGKRGGW